MLEHGCAAGMSIVVTHIGVRANIHLGGGRPSVARMESVGGGVVA